MTTDIEVLGRLTGSILLYIVAAIVLVKVFWIVQDILTPFNDKEERQRGNPAAWIHRLGGSVGIMVASTGSLIMSDQPLWTNLGMFLLDGVTAIAVFSIVMVVIFDPVVLPGIKNTLKIQQGNVAVALLEAFGFVAMGCIMCGSFAGSDSDLLKGQINGALWGLIGAVTLMVAFLLYVTFWAIFRACGINKQIAEGNIAAAIDAGTLLLTMGVVLLFNIMGDSVGFMQELTSYLNGLVAILAAFAARILIGLTFARGMGSTDKEGRHHGNVMKSLVVGVPSIAAALTTGLLIVGS
jgi:uncharacterized membrane protein YjfL (UPF0719 family)